MRLPVDHVTFAAHQLETLTTAFAAIGVAADYGGPHGNGVTHMAAIGLADGSYLECIAPMQPGAHSPIWHEAMAGNAGPAAWAVCDDVPLADTIARLRQRGITAMDPAMRSRKRLDGMNVVWELAAVGEGPMGSFHPFRIQDHTDRALRVAPTPAAAQANLTGVAGVVLATRNITAATATLRALYDLPPFRTLALAGLHMPVLACPGEVVMLADADLDTTGTVAARVDRFGPGPWIVLLRTTSIALTASRLNLPVTRAPDHQDVVWLPWPEALGGRIGIVADETGK